MDLRQEIILEFAGSHADSRRSIYDLLSPEGRFNGVVPKHISAIHVDQDGEVLGNHYHRRKDEMFYVANGSGILDVADLRSYPDLHVPKLASLLPQETETIEIQARESLLLIPRGIVHAFKMDKGSVLIQYAFGVKEGADPIDAGDNISYRLS